MSHGHIYASWLCLWSGTHWQTSTTQVFNKSQARFSSNGDWCVALTWAGTYVSTEYLKCQSTGDLKILASAFRPPRRQSLYLSACPVSWIIWITYPTLLTEAKLFIDWTSYLYFMWALGPTKPAETGSRCVSPTSYNVLLHIPRASGRAETRFSSFRHNLMSPSFMACKLRLMGAHVYHGPTAACQ